VRLRAFALLGFSTALLSAASALAQETRIDEEGKTPVEVKFIQNGRIRLNLCPGEVEVTGKDQALLRVSYYGRSSGNRVKVQIRTEGDQAEIWVRGCPHNNFELTVEVPKTSNVHARMFAGQMEVYGIQGDKDVELHAGQLTMEIGKPEDYAHVDASVVTGDLEASAFDVSKGGLFRSFDKSGPGKYRLHAHVGAGEIDLR
jgi:hypothetical protein